MNSQPKWDIYESVVLLNGYLLACKKSEPRAYIIRRVSADLRAMAIHRGRKIDEIFRNENGISYQMQSMDSAYKGRKIYVPATKLFQETVSLYRNQNSRFQELLKEARYMIEHDIAHPALNDTDVFVVDFNDCPDMSFARVNSLTYRGQAILIRPKWRDLYIALLKKLYADYSNEIDSVVGKVYGRASAPFVGNCHSISLMRSPGEFAPDRYVKKQIGSGEATWLWNMDTGLEELRKLLVDYKIILQSTQLGIKSASFFSCMQAWKEYTRYIKSPASVITAKCPELMYFIGCLKDIAENGEISHEKHEKFLAELTEKASIISALKEEKIAIFKETYSLYLVGFNDAEVRKVYNTLPASSFTDDKSTFEKNVSAISDEIRSEQERFRLLELWEEKTGTKNAYEWSEKNRTPIKAMVSVDEQVNAFKLFDAINYPNTEASKVSDALSYLKSNPGFIASLTDKSKIDTAFIRVIVKKYYAILTDLDAVRDHLEKVIPKAPYSWYGDPAVSTEIEKLANSKYRTGGNSVVMQRIDKMDAEEAKKYLRKLVQEDVEVGISIISKEGI